MIVETIKLYDSDGTEYRANPDQVEDCLRKGWTLTFSKQEIEEEKEDSKPVMKRKK